MNLQAAQALAAQMPSGGASGTTSCASAATSLIVIVYRDDDNEVIAAAPVKLTAPVANRFLSKESGKKGGTIAQIKPFSRTLETDGSGIARLTGLVGDFGIAVGPLVDPDGVLGLPAGLNDRLRLNDSHVVSAPVHVKSRPEIVLQWTYDNSGVQGVTITLTANAVASAFTAATDGNGSTKWIGPALEPGPYACAFTFPAGKHEIFDATLTAQPNPAVVLPPGVSATTFKVRALRTIGLRFVDGAAEMADVGIKYTWPEGGATREVRTADDGIAVKASVIDIPAVNGPATRFAIESVEIPDTAGEDYYEVIGVTTT